MGLAFLLFAACMHSATFSVSGDTAVMVGEIDRRTPSRVADLLAEHPDVATIEMRDVPGSRDDFKLVEAARLIRDAGLHTHVPSDGLIASGGVDFFIAGASRAADSGAKLGVHSWSGSLVEGRDLPEDDPEHDLYLDFYDEMGIDASFYWFTLEAASASDIHWMTEDEIVAYGLVTD